MIKTIVIVIATTIAFDVQSADLRESNQKGIALIQESLKAYGGQESLENLRLSLTVVSNFVNEGQSVTALGPFESYPWKAQIKIDKSDGLFNISSEIAGDFRFIDQTVLKNGKGYSIDPIRKTFEETEGDHWSLDFLLPHRRLFHALQNASSVRFINGSTVSYATSSGQIFTLRFDPETHLIRKVEHILAMGIYGDGYREYEFNYLKSFLPQLMVMRNYNAVHGMIENSYEYQDISTDIQIHKELELPSGFTKTDYSYRGNFKLNELAKDVYLIENVSETTGQWSYNVLFVVFDDFVLVAEAPVNSAVSEKVIQKIHETAPGKKIRYVVQSHHHNDHIGGIRPYIAEGATILAGPGLVPLIEKISSAPFSLNPDRLVKQPVKPLVESITKTKMIQDSNHKVIIFNIGPSPHAKDMLITYLPAQKILYQSDMINAGEYPENETTRHFRNAIKDLNLEITIIAGLHGKTIPFNDSNSPQQPR